MAVASRQDEPLWEGSLAAGKGTLSSQSGAIDGLPVTWAARTEAPGGKTSPEELAAAAHSSCFSMALALRLGSHDAEPERLVVRCVVTLEDVRGVPTIVSSELDMTARVRGFRRAVRHRGHFPNEQSPLNVLFLVATQQRKNRQDLTGKISGWKTILNTLTVHYGERIESSTIN